MFSIYFWFSYLSIIHDDMIFPIHMHDENNVVLSGSVGEKSKHGDATLGGKCFVVKYPSQKWIETFCKNPSALILYNPILHFT